MVAYRTGAALHDILTGEVVAGRYGLQASVSPFNDLILTRIGDEVEATTADQQVSSRAIGFHPWLELASNADGSRILVQTPDGRIRGFDRELTPLWEIMDQGDPRIYVAPKADRFWLRQGDALTLYSMEGLQLAEYSLTGVLAAVMDTLPMGELVLRLESGGRVRYCVVMTTGQIYGCFQSVYTDYFAGGGAQGSIFWTTEADSVAAPPLSLDL